MSIECPSCQTPMPASNRFCEECGAAMLPSAAPLKVKAAGEPCPGCRADATQIDDQGFCTRCGLQRLSPDRDHMEIVLLPSAAAVSDRGLKSSQNEDFMALEQTSGRMAVVVCDGVSNSQQAQNASQVAAVRMCEVMLQSNTTPVDALLRESVLAAQECVTGLGSTGQTDRDPPETTLVAALVTGVEASIAWVGDSRAYFVLGSCGTLLTHDHSWANQVVDAGKMTMAEASKSPLSHNITLTVGGPPGTEVRSDEIGIREFSAAGLIAEKEVGWLILCSDGLWNYLSSADQLADLIGGRDDALGIGRILVEFAKRKGGRDNITVAAVRLQK